MDDSIIERLKGIGWEDELRHMSTTLYGPLGRLKQVDKLTELTSQGGLRI